MRTQTKGPTVLELADLDTLDGHSSIRDRLLAQIDNGILTLSHLLLLCVPILDCGGSHRRRRTLLTVSQSADQTRLSPVAGLGEAQNFSAQQAEFREDRSPLSTKIAVARHGKQSIQRLERGEWILWLPLRWQRVNGRNQLR
jgi:hypothetical protein